MQLFIPREIWKRCLTNAEHQIFSPSPENVFKKKKNLFKLKKQKVCSCVSAFSQPSRQPIHQISLRCNVVSLAWLCSSPPLLVSVCYVCICDCIQYVLYSVL